MKKMMISLFYALHNGLLREPTSKLYIYTYFEYWDYLEGGKISTYLDQIRRVVSLVLVSSFSNLGRSTLAVVVQNIFNLLKYLHL
jgi:hypothetical protein